MTQTGLKEENSYLFTVLVLHHFNALLVVLPLDDSAGVHHAVARLAGWEGNRRSGLVFTNSCINPFIYAAKYREFQHGVRRMVNKTESESGSAPI